ncbi:hypothetical protein BDZ91DRAFT_714686 [Kalaharituber pfeilii]|nr:hypothetical protein BDZ91DRAFT_714686 [Kalaharituber pfeilii]
MSMLFLLRLSNQILLILAFQVRLHLTPFLLCRQPQLHTSGARNLPLAEFTLVVWDTDKPPITLVPVTQPNNKTPSKVSL